MSKLRKLKNTAHLLLAKSANFYNGFPSRKLTVIGVTGTDGKTTTSNLIYHILRKAGYKATLVSTIGAIINDKTYETGFHVTTPSPFMVQKYLRLARNNGCTHFVIEVTSHALDQNRVHGVDFDIGILTNITHEHLDYHKDYEKYARTKLRLLTKSKIAIANSNGEWFASLKKEIPGDKLLTYSLSGKEKGDLSLLNLNFLLSTKLIGEFNLENILAAILVARVLKIDDKSIQEAIESFDPPVGRQEIIKKNPLIMVDFAHTPNSFERILPTLRKSTSGKLIHVFGSAGKRDTKKRPEMGKVASFYDDVIILTTEDNRGESVSQINSEIKLGIDKEKKVFEIHDRLEAISYAISIAEKNDTVLVTGKGHEKSMNLGSGEIPWSDQEAIKSLLGKYEI